MIPKIIPITDIPLILFPSSILIRINTIKGCVDARRAPKPLSTYLKAQTKTPLPYAKNKNPAIIQLMICFLLIAKLSFINLAMTKIKIPAVIKRIEAQKSGEICVPAILFNT